MKVQLVAKTEVKEYDFGSLVELNAAMCYNESFEQAIETSKQISVETLFKMGHHTPFESESYTFVLEDIPVSLVTFGLHETHPFYNTLQKSSRYTLENDYSRRLEVVESFLTSLDISPEFHAELSSFVYRGAEFYQVNIDQLVDAATDALHAERPGFQGSKLQALRLAQEQGRSILSTALPTQLTYTIDTITLISMYQAAWNKPLKDLLTLMMEAVILSGVDGIEEIVDSPAWWPKMLSISRACPTLSEPRVEFVSGGIRNCHLNEFHHLHDKMDLLHFTPKAKTKSPEAITFDLTMSTMTYGQFQRHRTVIRGETMIDSRFMLPPLIASNALWNGFVTEYWNEFLDLSEKHGTEIMHMFIPYGGCIRTEAMFTQHALAHFLAKRCCTRSQLEIFQIAHKIKCQSGVSRDLGAACEIGKCHEGKMYCGRDLNKDVWESRRMI